MPLARDRKAFPFLTTPFREGRGQFSPDGKWIAYTSDESRKYEVYVQSFPPSGFKRQVSAKGGDWARWRKDGGEMFYMAPDKTLMSVPIRTVSGSLEFGDPTALFKIPVIFSVSGDRAPFSYDVAPDGGRFLAMAPSDAHEAPDLTVIVNWQGESFRDKN